MDLPRFHSGIGVVLTVNMPDVILAVLPAQASQGAIRTYPMETPSSARTALVDAAWLRWALIAAGVVAWLVITHEFPLYFQRDEVQMMNWVNNHGVLDGFIPTPECGFSHDTAYRPLIYAYWWVLYKSFGLHFEALYFLTGLLFISTMAILFKLVAKISDSRAAYLSLLIWMAGFQFLMTVLFWLTEQGYLLMMILAMGGLYAFVTGLGASRLRVTAGWASMLASFLIWEPLALVMPTTAAVFIATRAKSLGWRFAKAAWISVAVFLIGPAYWLGLPFGRQRMSGTGASLLPTASDLASRFSYYMSHVFSGTTGMVLLVRAIYCISSRALARTRLSDGVRVLVSVVAAAAVAAAVVRLHLFALALLLILAAGLLLPRITYLFLPVVFVPIAGLLAFAEPSRTYLFLPSYALAALAAIQASRLWGDLRDWWTHRVTRPAVTVAVAFVALALLAVPIGKKVRLQAELLRLRSDVTQNVKLMTPHLKRLPRGASVVVVDYASMGFRFGKAMLGWSDREKLLHQAPVDSNKAQFWFNDIGRPDLRAVTFSDYASRPIGNDGSLPVYIWLQTQADHRFFATRKLRTEPVKLVRRRESAASLLRLRG